MHKVFAALALPLILIAAPLSSWAGDDYHHRHEGKQEFWEGPCKVEREWKNDGEYKEQRECKGVRPHDRHHDHQEKFRDGRCKVEREWKKDGEYKEKRECKGQPEHYRQPRAMYVPQLPAHAQPRQADALLIHSQIQLR